MKLKQWIKENGVKRSYVSQRVGCSEQSVTQWMRGKSLPPLKYLVKIQLLTEGKVDAIDFVENKEAKQ